MSRRGELLRVAAEKPPLLAAQELRESPTRKPMSANENLKPFISASFRSVWSLELLIYLKRRPGFHCPEEMIKGLHGSELVVTQALEWLVAGGLACCDEAGRASYQPASPDLASLVEQTEDLYGRKPDAVRRLIVAGAASGLTAFADAFRFRKD